LVEKKGIKYSKRLSDEKKREWKDFLGLPSDQKCKNKTMEKKKKVQKPQLQTPQPGRGDRIWIREEPKRYTETEEKETRKGNCQIFGHGERDSRKRGSRMSKKRGSKKPNPVRTSEKY